MLLISGNESKSEEARPEAQGDMLKVQTSSTTGLDLLKKVATDVYFIEWGCIICMA